jgi:FkbM family methyltransferase
VFVDFFEERDSGTYLDIGANIGLTTIPIARNHRVRCHSFEPDPGLFVHLLENIHRNCRRNVELHQLALGAENAEVPFSINTRGNRGNNRIAEEGSLKVRVARLDDLCLPCPEPLAAKIDTEGFEPFVLEGGRRALGNADLVAIEFHPHQIRTAGGDPDSVIEFLAGFRQLAVLPAESDLKPTYEETETICSRLREYAADTRDEIKYLDVIGRR